MTPITQNVAEQYVQKVMRLIHASTEERMRIESDLKAHLQEGIQGGEDMLKLVDRMGDPREVAAEFMAQIPLTYSSHWRRLGAFVIDMLLILLFGGLSGVLFAVLSNFVVPQHPNTTWEKLWGGALILFMVITANAAIAMIMAYFPVLEGRFGKTLGKRLLHMRVCTEEGLPVSAGQAILRRLSFYFEILPVDALFIFFNPKHQRGFDILAKTVVVDD